VQFWADTSSDEETIVKRLLSSKTTIDQQEYDVIIVGSGAVRRTLSVWFDENEVSTHRRDAKAMGAQITRSHPLMRSECHREVRPQDRSI
jgi:hypothetical protein